MSENESAILKKIRKLLSLATSENKQEAESAYKKAMELMVKHNIETVGNEKTVDEAVRFFTRETQEAKFVHQVLLNCFFVSILTRRAWNEAENKIMTRYRIVGEKTNLEIALYAHDFLITEFNRNWQIYRKKYNARAKHKQSYYAGLARGFQDSFNDIKNYNPDSMALVISKNNDAIEDYIKDRLGKAPKLVAPKINANHRDILSDGYSDGSNIKLNRPIESSRSYEGNLLA